ncbi:MAG: hypothetical protein LBL49_05200 [Clostridiales Family XIII bacterium]|jgi:hypothetical protein|nr:hypothetical protein [Clostridiales Family XIII bacterium]
MNCCVECFRDSEIRRIIGSVNKTGDCDFCGSTGVSVYPIGELGEVGEVEVLINSVVDEYAISDKGYCDLETVLLNEWSVFSDNFSYIITGNKLTVKTPAFLIDLVKVLCSAYRSIHDDLYSKTVVLRQSDDSDAMSEYGIVSGWTWDDFSEALKHYNRFHNHLFNPEILASFLTYAVKNYKPGTVFYRARRADDKDGLPLDKMGAPPSDKSTAGRINPVGISVLYLASNAEEEYAAIFRDLVAQDTRIQSNLDEAASS